MSRRSGDANAPASSSEGGPIRRHAAAQKWSTLLHGNTGSPSSISQMMQPALHTSDRSLNCAECASPTSALLHHISGGRYQRVT